MSEIKRFAEKRNEINGNTLIPFVVEHPVFVNFCEKVFLIRGDNAEMSNLKGSEPFHSKLTVLNVIFYFVL